MLTAREMDRHTSIGRLHTRDALQFLHETGQAQANAGEPEYFESSLTDWMEAAWNVDELGVLDKRQVWRLPTEETPSKRQKTFVKKLPLPEVKPVVVRSCCVKMKMVIKLRTRWYKACNYGRDS